MFEEQTEKKSNVPESVEKESLEEADLVDDHSVMQRRDDDKHQLEIS